MDNYLLEEINVATLLIFSAFFLMIWSMDDEYLDDYKAWEILFDQRFYLSPIERSLPQFRGREKSWNQQDVTICKSNKMEYYE